MRTLTALDALDKLDNFKDVFDVETYRKFYKWLYLQHVNGDEMNEPTYDVLKKRKSFKVNVITKVLAILRKLAKRFC